MKCHEDNNLGPDPISLSSEKYYSSTYFYFFSDSEVFTGGVFQRQGSWGQSQHPLSTKPTGLGSPWVQLSDTRWILHSLLTQGSIRDSGVSFATSMTWEKGTDSDLAPLLPLGPVLEWTFPASWPASGASALSHPGAGSQFLKNTQHSLALKISSRMFKNKKGKY